METTSIQIKIMQIESSLETLSREGFNFVQVGEFHFRYSQYDFWPTTGRYYDRVRGYKGRGVKRLIRNLKKLEVKND